MNTPADALSVPIYVYKSTRRLVRCLSKAALAALLLCPLAAAASDAIPVEAGASDRIDIVASRVLYLEDPGHRLGIADVSDPAQSGRFRPAGTAAFEVNFGYSDSAYWLMLPLQVAADASPRWQLEVGFPSLDHVEVYAPGPGGAYTMRHAGDREAFDTRPYPHRNFVFPLDLHPGATQVVFVKVWSAGTLTIPLTLWKPPALHAHDQETYAVLSIYYGMLLALLLYNLLLFLSVRDPVFLAYVAFAACMAVGQASLNGLGNQFLWPQSPEWGNIALPSGMAATGFFGALFTRMFLGTRQSFPRLDRLILMLAAGFALAALSPLVASYQFAAIFTSITGLVFATVAVAIGVYCQIQGHPGARYFLIAWTLLLLGVAVMSLRNLGWLPTTALTTYSMQLGSALEMLLLSFALADRINILRREKERVSAEALAAKQALVEALQRSEQELEGRVARRTHELETANAELRSKEARLQYLAQHDPLTGLANRTLLNDRLTNAIARARRSGRAVVVLVADLDEFKAVNDAHGHAVGDQALKAIATRLSTCVRESDTVARLGGDEFVIVLDELQDLSDSIRIAEKLLEVSGWVVQLEQHTLQISLSVGIACYPKDATNVPELLKQADDAMYAAKAEGRNCWQSASPLQEAVAK